MREYDVSISIVTYNNEDKICCLLDSIFKHTKAVDFHVTVVDNNSADGTVEAIKKNNYDLTLIENEENIGFGAAHNKALRGVDSKYHVFVNPDVMVDTDVISNIAAYMDEHKDIGIVTPKVLFPDGKLQMLPKKEPKLIYVLSRRLNIKPLRKYRAEYEMQGMCMDEVFDIEFATGCFVFARTDLLKKVGGFDKRYFLYFEDADLTKSIRRFARVQYNPSFYVYHNWDRAGAREFKYFVIQVMSMFKFLLKWSQRK